MPLLNENELLFDDDSHPIPCVHVIDAWISLDGGGAYFGLVIASPLYYDERSIFRLNRKFEGYVSEFFSPNAMVNYGTPKAGKMRIYVSIHPESDRRVFEILEEFEHRIGEKGIRLIVSKKLESSVIQH